METKHTKGEWAYDPNTSKDYWPIYCDNRIVIAEVGRRDVVNEAEANAKIMAAAPELLETLMELVNQVQVRHVEDENDPLWVAAKKGLAVINKATK